MMRRIRRFGISLVDRLAFGRLRPLLKEMRLGLISVAGSPGKSSARVSYGHAFMGERGAILQGGHVKFAALHAVVSNSPWRFNVLYLSSSTLPQDWPPLLRLARKKKAKIVWNQNGVSYPALTREGWEEANQPMKRLLHEADYVIYQSRFSKSSADRFLGPGSGPWEVLYNPVDTERFRPEKTPRTGRGLTLLHAGSIQAFYRLETAVGTLSELVRLGVDASLMVAGRLAWGPDRQAMIEQVDALIKDMSLGDRIRLLGPYSRTDAPSVFRPAHILLHTKVNDCCPNVVLEAMASGLPVVYSDSGGTGELVGDHAGIGVPDRAGWDEEYPARPADLAQAVLKVAGNMTLFAEAARSRAVEKFDVRFWVRRHQELFQAVLNSR